MAEIVSKVALREEVDSSETEMLMKEANVKFSLRVVIAVGVLAEAEDSVDLNVVEVVVMEAEEKEVGMITLLLTRT